MELIEYSNKWGFTYFVLALGLPPQAAFSIVHSKIQISPARQLFQQSICWMEEAGFFVQKGEADWYYAFKSQTLLDNPLEVDLDTRCWQSTEHYLRMTWGIIPYDWFDLVSWEADKLIGERYYFHWEFDYPHDTTDPTTSIELYERVKLAIC